VPADMTIQPAQRDLLDLLGGESGIPAVIEDFHRRLLADPTLAPAFAGMDFGTLRRHHITFLTYLLGGPGPQPISAAGLRAAHEPRRVTSEQFSAVIAHLVGALPQDNETQRAVPAIVERLAWLRPHVVYDEIICLRAGQAGSLPSGAASDGEFLSPE
jgi:hemoglobin